MKRPSLSIVICATMARFVLSFHLRFGSRALHDLHKASPGYVAGIRFFSSASSESDKKRVVFLGTPDVAATTLKRLFEDSRKETSIYDIVSVITQPPKRRKRKGQLEPSPVGKVAEELGIPVLHPEKVRTGFMVAGRSFSTNLTIETGKGSRIS